MVHRGNRVVFAGRRPFRLDAGDQQFQPAPVLGDLARIGDALALAAAVERAARRIIDPPPRLRAGNACLLQGSANSRFHAGQVSVSVPGQSDGCQRANKAARSLGVQGPPAAGRRSVHLPIR